MIDIKFFLMMDYLQIYESLVTSAKVRKLSAGQYYEKHHIWPKSMGGPNDEFNIVKLTGREHFIAHRLLAKIFPDSSIVHAPFLMACKNKKNKYGVVTSRLYEILRKAHAERVSKDRDAAKKKGRPGRKQAREHVTNRVLSRRQTAQWISANTALKISKAKLGKPSTNKGIPKTAEQYEKHMQGVNTRKKNGSYAQTPEHVEKRASQLRGRTVNRVLSDDQLDALRREKSKTVICPFCKKEGQCMVMHRWHFDNCKKNPNKS